jgi:hypothetical protein
MDAQVGPVLVGLFVVGMVALWYGADRADVRPVRARVPRFPAPPPPVRRPERVAAEDRLPATGALVVVPPVGSAGGAPTEPVPLRDWMVHLHAGPRSKWTELVRELTAAALADPVTGPGLAGTDPATVQRYFLALLMALTGEGLTADAVHRVGRAQAAVPLTAAGYDTCARLVVDGLQASGVPGPTLRHVAYLLLVLRDSVVAPAVRPVA